jgi:proteasome accessory factor C
MDKLHRIKHLKGILLGRRTPITLRRLMAEMECSESTARRLLYSYRDDFGAPLAYDRQRRGWYLKQEQEAAAEELPGAWFTPAELHALVTARELLRQLQPGLLAEQTAPIAARIERLLKDRGLSAERISKRVRLVNVGGRDCPNAIFTTVAHALLERVRLRIRYHGRGHDANSGPNAEDRQLREVSPQRLTWSRGNWYLDAWCHQAEALRRFAIERIQRASVVAVRKAEDIDDEQLDRYFNSAFGLFAGPATATAILRFTQHRAAWVAEETWHPEQSASWLPDGRYQLSLPYSHTEELLMDILKYGPDCEVLAPPELRTAAADRLRRTLAQYEGQAGRDQCHNTKAS